MEKLVVGSAQELLGSVGRPLGPTSWLAIDQQRIDAFAAATGDHQWIHVDVERARHGPFKGTIAHGYLTLSLVSFFLPQMLEVTGAEMGVNYGCDKVRFPAAVRAGSRVRGSGEILQAEKLPGAQEGAVSVQVKIRVNVEIEEGGKPACVAETLARWYFRGP